jgi:hypothetical protein
MSRRKNRGRRAAPDRTRQPQLKRRLPLTPPRKEPLLPGQPPSVTEAQNPYALKVAEQIRRVCAIAHLPFFTVLEDWTGMLEAALRFYADNARAYAMTGRFIDDPPDVQETYRRARERYLKANETYPATYREMQAAFSHTFALLVTAAGPDLGWYAAQSAFSPDVIGRVYLDILGLGQAWWPYFPPWPAALEAAQAAIPNGEELACEILVQAHLKYRLDRPADYIHPEPGELFEQWFTEILLYSEPLIIGPDRLDSSTMMLAAAAQFPDWAVKDGLVLLYPHSGQPQLDRLARINAMLYGLNGYDLEMARTVQDIAAYLDQQPEPRRRPEPSPPAEPETPLPPPDTETITPVRHPSTGRIKPADQATFSELFRRIR